MIGFYDYTVVLTFLSILTSVFGMTQAMDGHFRIAIVCLALSGLFDTFDGKVARTKKDRSECGGFPIVLPAWKQSPDGVRKRKICAKKH